MSYHDWSDHHAWPVSADQLSAAELALPDVAARALSEAAQKDGAGYLVPREAIEDAALAMPPALAVQFVAAVYELDQPNGEMLLNAIRIARKIKVPKPGQAFQKSWRRRRRGGALARRGVGR